MDGTNNGYLELLNLTEINADILNTPYITCNTITASVGNITTGNITTINSTTITTTNESVSNLTIPTLSQSKLVLTDASKKLISSAYTDSDMAIKSVSNVFTGTTNTFNNTVNLAGRTASKILLTDTSKNIVSSTLNDTDLATLAGSNVFTGTTNTFNNTVNLAGRTASKLLLTDASKNITSSLYTDSDFARLGASSNTFTGTALSLVPSTASDAEIKILTNDSYISKLSLKEFSDVYGSEFIYNGTTNLGSIVRRNGATTETIMDWEILTGNTRLLKPVAFSSTITMPLGSVGTPSLTFSGDTNTGIFSAGADTINLTTNGTTRLYASNSGVNVPNLTASKLVLSDASDNLVSSLYTDSDFARLGASSNTFTGTALSLVPSTASNAEIKILTNNNLTSKLSLKEFTDNFGFELVYTGSTNIGSIVRYDNTPETIIDWNCQTGATNFYKSTTFGSNVSITSGVITMPLGSVGTPSLTFSGDTNTGIFSAGADTINLTTNGTTRLYASNSGVNIPNLTGSRIVLTDSSNNLVSSAYTDTSLLNNDWVETYPRATSSALLTFTNQRAYYVPIVINSTKTYSSISVGFQIPAGATQTQPFMGSMAVAIYSSTNQVSTHPYYTSSIPNAIVSGTSSGLCAQMLTNTPSTKSSNSLFKYTFSSPVSLSTGQYFIGLLSQTSSFNYGSTWSNMTATISGGSSSLNITSMASGSQLGLVPSGSISTFFMNTTTATFTGRIDNGTPGIAGTTLTISVLPSQYNIFIGMYISGSTITGGTRINSGSGSVWTVSISQSVASTTITSNSADYITGALAYPSFSSFGTSIGNTGTFNMSSTFGTTGCTGTISTLTISATANPFTLMNYTNANLSTQNYAFEQSTLTSLPSTATPTSSQVMPYMLLST